MRHFRRPKNSQSIFQNNSKTVIAIDLLNGLNKLRENGTFCDIKLKAGDTVISAHKSVLCACSPYFSAMFSGPFQESRQNEIVIKDIDPDSLQIIVDYLYTGLLKFNSTNVERILLTSSFLQITSAQEMCCSFLITNLVLENCIEYIIFAGKHSIKNLCEKALEMAVLNFHVIFTKDDFLKIEFDEFKQLIEILKSNAYIEDTVYSFAMRWINFNYEKRVNHLKELLDLIDPNLISPNMLVSPAIEPGRNHLWDHWAASVSTTENNESLELILLSKRIGDFQPRTIKLFNQSSPYQIDTLPCEYDGSYACNGYYIYHTGGWKSMKTVVNNTYAYNQLNNIWLEFVPLLQARAYHRSGVLNGIIYTLGGSDGLKALSTVETMDLHKGVRSWCEPMPRAKEQMGFTFHDNSIYIIGGRDRGVPLKCSARLDPRVGNWEDIGSKAYRDGASSCAVVNEEIYTTHSDAMQRYDIRTNRWTLIRTQYDRYPDEVFSVRNELYGLFKDHIARYVPSEGKWLMQRQFKFHHNYLNVSTDLRVPQSPRNDLNDVIENDIDEIIDERESDNDSDIDDNIMPEE